MQPFNDAGPSIPVGFTSARWGSLASFGARAVHGHEEDVRHERQQLRRGRRVRRQRAREGGDRRRRERRSASPHFNDQAERYSTGDLRDVYFYPSQLRVTRQRTYQSGELKRLLQGDASGAQAEVSSRGAKLTRTVRLSGCGTQLASLAFGLDSPEACSNHFQLTATALPSNQRHAATPRATLRCPAIVASRVHDRPATSR